MVIYQNVLNEAHQTHETRKPLLDKIEEHFNRKVVSFYTSFSRYGAINDRDVDMLKDILVDMGSSEILLIISSPGGDPLAAERFIKVCREFSDDGYFALIPGKAKSAATMISLGSSKMIMTPTSELGPIDIQIPWQDQLIPASVVISAYDDLVKKGIELPKGQNIEPILQQLQHFNEAKIKNLRMTKDLSKDIAIKILKEGKLKDVAAGQLDELLNPFIEPEELKDHGRPIFHSDLAEIDKNNYFRIELLQPSQEIYRTVHEFHMRMVFAMDNGGYAKLFETQKTSFFTSGKE